MVAGGHGCAQYHGSVRGGSPATKLFLKQAQQRAAQSSGQPTNHSAVLVFDVGANNGAFSASMAAHVAQAPGVSRRWARHMFEPQRAFAAELQGIANKYEQVVYHAAVAGKAQGNETIYLRRNSETVSTLRPLNARMSGPRKSVVDTIAAVDLARVIIDEAARMQVPGEPPPLVLLKLDIEGAEYSLLPHSLITGAICHLSVLRVEWHLTSLPSAERLGGLGLRLGLRQTILSGCAGKGAWVGSSVSNLVTEDEDYVPMNSGVPIPGLLAEAALHEPVGRTQGEVEHGGIPLGVRFNMSVAHKRGKVRASRGPQRIGTIYTTVAGGMSSPLKAVLL